jgi:GT2 family glycosyltransferase
MKLQASVLYVPLREIARIERQIRGLARRVIGPRRERRRPSVAEGDAIATQGDPAQEPVAAPNRRVLVCDYRVPNPETWPDERATFGILRNLCSFGFEVAFAPGHITPTLKGEAELRAMGVEVVIRNHSFGSLSDYIRQRGRTFGLFYLFASNSADEVLGLIRQVAPEATAIFHAPDLHFVRPELGADDAIRTGMNRASLLGALNAARALPFDLFIEHCRAEAPRPMTEIGADEPVDVSIVIPVFNRWRGLTQPCLTSILETTAASPYRIEIILADDHSFDETFDAATMIPGLRVVRTDKNVGFLRNCNNAASQARGRHLLLLNNDTIVLPGWLDGLVETLDGDPTIAIAGSKLLYPDGAIQEAGAAIFNDGTAVNLGRGDARDTPIFNYERGADYISGASIIIRGAFWRYVGGFDEAYKEAYCEDSDLAMTARSLGLRVVYQPRSEVIHFENQSYDRPTSGEDAPLQVHNIPILREKWRETLAREHGPPSSWQVAMAQADRTPSARALERRASGRFNVLYFSPFQSHPLDQGNRSTSNHFARRVQDMGHKVHFVSLQTQVCDPADVAETPNAWDTLDVLPSDNPSRIPENGEVPWDDWYPEGLGEQICQLCARYDIDVVFCSYVFHSKLLEFVPAHVLKVIDTHDKMGDRYERLRTSGQPRQFFSCSPAEEGAYLRRADVVVADQIEAARYFDRVSGRRSAIVIPYFEQPSFLKRPVASLANVGIVANPNEINLATVRHFLEALDQRLQGGPCPFTVTIVGRVDLMVERLPSAEKAIFRRSWVRLAGFIPNIADFYKSVDLVVSLVTMGTGLNTKSVEAMAFGMPLLTTVRGSKGIETGDPLHAHPNLTSLVDSLIDIREKPGELARLVRISRERYEQFYSDALQASEALFAQVRFADAPLRSALPSTSVA